MSMNRQTELLRQLFEVDDGQREISKVVEAELDSVYSMPDDVLKMLLEEACTGWEAGFVAMRNVTET